MAPPTVSHRASVRETPAALPTRHADLLAPGCSVGSDGSHTNRGHGPAGGSRGAVAPKLARSRRPAATSSGLLRPAEVTERENVDPWSPFITHPRPVHGSSPARRNGRGGPASAGSRAPPDRGPAVELERAHVRRRPVRQGLRPRRPAMASFEAGRTATRSAAAAPGRSRGRPPAPCAPRGRRTVCSAARCC